MFFNVRKVNRVVKFDGSEHRHCEDIKGISAPEIGRPKSYGTFEKNSWALYRGVLVCGEQKRPVYKE